MASEVDICNLALVHIGETPNISSINPPEDSAYAERCARFYPLARDVTLEAPNANWSFARKRAALAALTVNNSAYDFAYQLPSDCLRPRLLLPVDYTVEDEQGRGEDFRVEGDILYSNAESPTLLYTFRQTAVTKYTPLFVDCVGKLLGYYLAGAVAKDEGLQRRLWSQWQQALAQGAQSNGNVGKTTYDMTPIWMKSR